MKRTKPEPAWELPLDAGPGCVGYRIRLLNRITSAVYEEAFGSLRLRISQFAILMMLSRRGASTAGDLCKLLVMDKSTASRNLERMRRRGWISLTRNGGRARAIALTGEGVRILRAAYPRWRTAQAEASRRLGPAGLDALATVMARMTA